MTLSIITPEQTINQEDVLDITIPTAHGAVHMDKHNGSVELLQKGKTTIVFKRKDHDEEEKIEFFVEDGVVYVEHGQINMVTAEAKPH